MLNSGVGKNTGERKEFLANTGCWPYTLPYHVLLLQE